MTTLPPTVRPAPKCLRTTRYIIGNVILEERIPITPGQLLPMPGPGRYIGIIDTVVDVGAQRPLPIKDLEVPMPAATDLAKAYAIICDEALFMSLVQTATDNHVDRLMRQHQSQQHQRPVIQIATDLPTKGA